jgi:hypothetical protein
MPKSLIENPDHWRKRAEEARALAKQLEDDAVAKRSMLVIARNYDRLALHAQEAKRSNDKK